MTSKAKTIKYRLTSPTSEVIDTHDKAVTFLMHKYHLSRVQVRGILEAFFGKWGLKYFLYRGLGVQVNGLGTFYFHRATLKKNALKRQRILEYNARTKQRLYASRQRKVTKSK